jgi:hypothetical protein
MTYFRNLSALAIIAFAAVASTAPASARPAGMGGGMGWGGPGWGGGSDWDRPSQRGSWQRDRSARDDREGKVEVTRFLAEGAAAEALGHGTITVAAAPAGDDADAADPRELATYEAAVIDQLAHAGYDTATHDSAGGQVTELRIVHDVVAPEEAPHKPVSGEMSVGVGTYGSSMGLGIAIDLTKPRKALVSTRLEARIRDRVSGNVLWEGRADIATRDGSERWTDSAIAVRLAEALFDKFPGHSGETVAAR